MIAFALSSVALVVSLGLFFIGFRQTAPSGPSEAAVAKELKILLQQRTEGSVSSEEFEARQAVLHAQLLQPRGGSHGLRWKFLAAGTLLFLGAAVTIWKNSAGDQATTAPPVVSGPGADATGNRQGGDLRVLVGRLAEKMAKDPSNGEGWSLLAHTYAELQQHKEAADAFARAAALLPPNARLLSDWADSYVLANNRQWDAKAADIVAQALKADAKFPKALALAGSEAFSRADYKQAIAYWKRMKAASPPDSGDAKLADANIAEAQGLLSGKKPAPVAAPVSAGTGISGSVMLDPGLKGSVAAGDTVFVIAKAPDGSAPPLAVKRYVVADLPVRFQLGDADAMVPGRTLSQFGEVSISVKISKSGSAMPQASDISTKPVMVKTTGANVELVVSR